MSESDADVEHEFVFDKTQYPEIDFDAGQTNVEETEEESTGLVQNVSDANRVLDELHGAQPGDAPYGGADMDRIKSVVGSRQSTASQV